jgi:integrase
VNTNAKVLKVSETKEDSMSKRAEFLQHIKSRKSKNTFILYKAGLNRFLEWYGKTAEEILAEAKEYFQSEQRQQKDFFKYKIEEFFKYMIDERHLSRNSARSLVGGICSFLDFYGYSVKLDKDVTKVVETTQDFEANIDTYRRMFNVADLRERVVISLSLDLGFRVGDLLSIKIRELPDLEQEAPLAFQKMTGKEHEIAKTFLSAETAALLKDYIPTLNKENEYLFQSNTTHHLDESSINYMLKELAAKAKIQIPEGQRIRYHCFRKIVYATMLNSNVPQDIAKYMIGKAVSASIKPYIEGYDRKTAFLSFRGKLALMNGHRIELQNKDAQIAELNQRLHEQEILLKGLISAFGEEIFNKAQEALKAQLGDKYLGKPIDPIEWLIQEGKQVLTEQEKERVAAIKKGLEELSKENGENHS